VSNASQTEPERLPLRERVSWREPNGVFVDGFTVVTPDHPDYERCYADAVFMLREFDQAMPYATAEDIAAAGAAQAGAP